MSIKAGICWIILFIGLNACVSFNKLTIEVMKPARYSLNPEVKKIALVSRNLVYDTDTLQNFHVNDGKLVKDHIKAVDDTLVLKICFDSLVSKLSAQNRFERIDTYPVNLYPQERVKKVGPGKAAWYKNIADETKDDGIIILDMFSCFYSSYKDMYSNRSANVVTSNIWTFYDCKREKITDRFVQTDTLVWEGTNESGLPSNIRIPGKNEAILLASGVIGENYAKHILPSWMKVDRDLMTSRNYELIKAGKLAQKNKWEDAKSIWLKNSDAKNTKVKLVALYNLALANEMNGEIDEAIKFTDEAAKASAGWLWSLENEAVRKYSVVLHQRKNEIQKLKKYYEFP